MKRVKIGEQWYEFDLGNGVTAGIRSHSRDNWGYYLRSHGRVVGKQEYRISSYRLALDRIRMIAAQLPRK